MIIHVKKNEKVTENKNFVGLWMRWLKKKIYIYGLATRNRNIESERSFRFSSKNGKAFDR